MNILEKIIKSKKEEIKQECRDIAPEIYGKTSTDQRIPRGFIKALDRQNQLSIIAEIKKASPSKGVIRESFDPIEIALQYADYGADCLSILTDTPFFQGEKSYLSDIEKVVKLPILRKDFIVDPRQIRQSYELGADAILLIVACLQKEQLIYFKQLADSFLLDCLVEVHTAEELKIALELNFPLVGINNRNLNTFKTDLNTSIELKRLIPQSTITVSESGISSSQDCKKLLDCGFDALLVGEAFMREEHPGKALLKFQGK